MGLGAAALAKCLSHAVTNSAQAASPRANANLFQCTVLCVPERAQECLFLVGAEGRARALAGQEAALGKPEAVPRESAANPMELEFGTGTG